MHDITTLSTAVTHQLFGRLVAPFVRGDRSDEVDSDV